jgi:signal transduction histidine kinase
MNGFAQILQSDFAGQLPPKAQNHIRRISESAVNMDKLVTGLLEFARLNWVGLTQSPVDPEVIVREALAALRSRLLKRKPFHDKNRSAGAGERSLGSVRGFICRGHRCPVATPSLLGAIPRGLRELAFHRFHTR